MFREAIAFMENRESFGPSEDTPNDIFVLLSQQSPSERYGSVQSEILIEEYKE